MSSYVSRDLNAMLNLASANKAKYNNMLIMWSESQAAVNHAAPTPDFWAIKLKRVEWAYRVIIFTSSILFFYEGERSQKRGLLLVFFSRKIILRTVYANTQFQIEI